MSVTKEDFISKWQELHLEGYHLLNNDSQQIDDKCRVEKHVDVIRNTLSHLQFAKLCGIVSTTCANHLFLKYADVYGTLIDSSVTDSGLDNFAEIVLSQNEGRLNESQQWKSSLTLPGISEKSYVKEVTEQSLLTPDATLPTKHSIEISQQEVGVSSTVLSSGYQPAANISVAKPVITSTDIQNQTKHALFDGNSCTDRSQGIWGSTCSTKGFKDVQNSGPNVQYPASESGCANTSVKYGNQKVPVQASKRAWNASDDTSAEGGQSSEASAFRTAKEQLIMNEKKLYRGSQASAFNYGTNKKSLGTRRGLNSKFVPPVINKDVENNEDSVARRLSTAVLGKKPAGTSHVEKTVMDERLKNLDPKMIELITNEIMDHGPPVTWNDVAGLEFAKKTIKEIVVWPMLRPDIFTGLRGPPKGLLLFGPPGTGKTLIGKCIASQSKSTFFSISASSLTSKWVGEGEKMVRVLFGVARVHQPAVIFIDEIDSLLSRRTDGEHEGSRRIKTEFLIQLEGATTAADDRILVVGATNRPQEIDEAARRRFVKRLYIPLPDTAARKQIVMNLMSQQHHSLTEEDVESICLKSDGYSGSDVSNLCREAALGPIRSMRFEDIENIEADQVRPIAYQDFMDAFKQVRASVSQKDLNIYIDWNKEYGSWPVE